MDDAQNDASSLPVKDLKINSTAQKRNVFKENWLKVDETCPNCHHITKRQKGMTKQNLKRLITPQFNFTEILITFMLIMVLVLAFAYQNETKQCRDWIQPMFSGDEASCEWTCNSRCNLIYAQQQTNMNDFGLNLTNGFNGLNDNVSIQP